jgi:hypothetical protein
MNNTGFVAGTLVHTDKGLVPIQDIEVGDMVLSRPEWGDKNVPTEYKRVSRAFCSGKSAIYRVVYIDNDEEYIDGEQIKAKAMFVSKNHHVWIEKREEWITVRDLKDYETVLSSFDSSKDYTVVSVYPIFEIEVSSTYLANIAISLPLNKFGHCTQSDIRPDIDAIIFSTSNELQCHKIEEWGDLYDINYGKNSIPEEIIKEFDTLDVNTSNNFFNTKVYNIELKDFHTYFIGHAGLWVHNTNVVNQSHK